MTAAPLRIAPLQILPDHPALAGHFPGRPIVPGVVLLDELLHAIEQDSARLGGWLVEVVKFHRSVLPGEPLQLEVATEGNLHRFTVHSAGQLVVSGAARHVAACTAPQGTSA